VWLSAGACEETGFESLSPEAQRTPERQERPAQTAAMPKGFWERVAADTRFAGAVYKELEMRIRNVEAFIRGCHSITAEYGIQLASYFQVHSLHAITLGQDWVRFCREGIIDVFHAGHYAFDVPSYLPMIDDGIDVIKGKVKALAGVCKGLWDSGQTASTLTMVRQAEIAMTSGYDGIAIFCLRAMGDEDFREIARLKDIMNGPESPLAAR
jgi:hypothetical protein